MTFRNDTPPAEWYEPDEIVEDFWEGRDIWWVEQAVYRAEVLVSEGNNPYWSYLSRLTHSQRSALSDRVGRVANEWYMTDEIINTSRDKEEFENIEEWYRFKSEVDKVVWFVVADTEDEEGHLIVPDAIVEELAEWVVGLREGA